MKLFYNCLCPGSKCGSSRPLMVAHMHTCNSHPYSSHPTQISTKSPPCPMTPIASLLTASKFWLRNSTLSEICRSTLGYATASTPRRQFSQCGHLQHQHPPLRILFCGSDHFSATSLKALYQEHKRDPHLIESIDVVTRDRKSVV